MAKILLPISSEHTLSPNAINYYLLLPAFQTEHSSHLRITVDTAIRLNVPSLPTYLQRTGRDLFRAEIVLPVPTKI
jgi:hypothetical protein